MAHLKKKSLLLTCGIVLVGALALSTPSLLAAGGIASRAVEVSATSPENSFDQQAAPSFDEGEGQAAVSSLSELYDGDEKRAREQLQTLYEAGVVDKDGKMIDLDVRVNGESADLMSVAMPIAMGNKPGNVTVNGKSVSAEQIIKLEMMREELALADLLSEKVKITDEHIAHLNLLLNSIAEGNTQFSEEALAAIESLSNAPLLGSAGDDELPSTATANKGNLNISGDKFIAPYIDGSTYTPNYGFDLLNSSNTTFYTDDRYDGAPGTAISSSKPTVSATVTGSGGGATLTFNLSAATDADVSFDYKVDGVTGSMASGTVSWAAGESGEKKVDVGYDSWAFIGTGSAVANFSNIQNATFTGGKTALYQTFSFGPAGGWLPYQLHADNNYEKTYSGSLLNSYWYRDPNAGAYVWRARSVGSTHIGAYERFYQGVVDWIPENQMAYGIYLGLNKEGDYASIPIADTRFCFYNPSDSSIGYNVDYPIGRGDGRWITNWNTAKNDIAKYIDANGKIGIIVDILIDKDKVNHPNKDTTYPPLAPVLKEIKIRYAKVPTSVVATASVSPAIYRPGEMMPVQVTFDAPVVADKNTKIKVNNTTCSLLSIDDNTLESKRLAFGYPVKDGDPSTISVSEITGLKNHDGDAIDATEIKHSSIGPVDKVYIASGLRTGNVDFSNAKYGVDDTNIQQNFTAVIPLKSNAETGWITSDALECTQSGQGISMVLPSFGAVEIKHYLRSAYFSYDGGMTRYPAYIVTSGENEKPVAFATKFAVPQNLASYVRRDMVNFYMADYSVAEEEKYLPDWSEAKVDASGCAYFLCGTDTTGNGNTFAFTPDENYLSAPIIHEATYQYFIKDAACFSPSAYVTRTQHYVTEGVEQGYIKLDNGKYVVLTDPEHPENQHDVELLISEGLYQAITKGYIRSDGEEYTISYQISNRIPFTYSDEAYMQWFSSDEKVAKVVGKEGTQDATILFSTASNNKINFGLRVLNGAQVGQTNYRTYELDGKKGGMFTVALGKDPYFRIPSTSKDRTTLTNTEVDVFFSTNLTMRNLAADDVYDTWFNFEVYRVDAKGFEVPEGAEPVFKVEDLYDYSGGVFDPYVGHITIPASVFTETGYYVVRIHVDYIGGEPGVPSAPATFEDFACITVKEAPAKVTLNKLDSYTAMDNAVPAISYTVNSNKATVMYTIQKSGEAVGEKTAVTDGVIPFAPAAPAGLKDLYVITVYARNSENDPWSVDSLSFTVYNHDALDIIIKEVASGEIGGTTGGSGTVADGTTVTMSNAERVLKYLNESGYQLTFADFNAMRTDISLQRIVSVNYGSGLWGALSDKMQWTSSNPDALGINYAEGGYYADINVYSYTSYSPYSDFLIVGKDNAEKVTVTAKHAATGLAATFDVNVETLKGKLFLFQFYPKTKTSVHYINNDNVERSVETDEFGRLAVYEPKGIKGSVRGYAKVDGDVYVGTVMLADLISGEADIATLKLYPCNNVRLRGVSSVQLTFLGSDNKPYNGKVILRGGVYKNDTYCPEARLRVSKDDNDGQDGRNDIVATVSNGKLNVWFDATQFKNKEYPEGFLAGDRISYVFEYRFAEKYQPGYVILNTVSDGSGGAKATDSLIQLKDLRGAPNSPQITAQTLQQYHGEEHTPNGYTRNVVDFNENIGISKEFNMAKLYSDIALLGETLELDDDGNRIYSGNNVLNFAIYKADGTKLAGQSESKTSADRIFNLTDLEGSDFFIFPFSAVPFLRSTYTMDADTLAQSGIYNYRFTATGLKATFTREGVVVRTETLPYGVANLSNLPDVKNDSSSIAGEIKSNLEQSLNLGDAFKGINTDAMVKNGLVFLSGMQTGGSKYAPHLVILPTANPEVFKILAFIGSNQREGDDGDGFSVNYDPDQLSEDFDKFKEALDEMGDSDNDSDNSGEGSLDFNFYGAIQLQTQWNASKNSWDISFTGGNVGGNIKGKYEWSYQLMCGPYPFLFTLELGFHVDAELAFANKDGARAMLLDAAFGISIEAFAGLGFDMSLVSFQLGIFGMIKADFNFLWFSDGNKTGSQLSLKGEIGIRMKVKLLFVSFSQTFASFPFNILTKKYGQYDQIRAQWESLGYAELSGTTRLGRSYKLLAFPDGTAIAAIEGEAEIENRDYLDLNERFWYSSRLLSRKRVGGLTTIQGNAYPYSAPVFSEDGSMFVYLSDNDVSTSVQSSASYALIEDGAYVNKGKIDGSDETAADTGLDISGSGNHVYATWIRQIENPERESSAWVTNDDLGMMLNAAEIYGATYDGSKWTTTRLTENSNADLSPVVASSGEQAIVAWRSLNASSMPKEYTADLSMAFDVENNVAYRIYKNGQWSDAVIAYNGSAGTVSALDVSMLNDGTALIAYSVRTGEADTSTETFYTLIDKDGQPLTTTRLTNDSVSDLNVQVTALSDGFLLGWYSEPNANIISTKSVKAHDFHFAHVYTNGSVDAGFLESVGGNENSSYTSNFRFSSPSGNLDLNKVSIVWSHKVQGEQAEDDGKYEIEAMRFHTSGGEVGFTAPISVIESAKNVSIDHFDAYTDASGKLYTIMLASDYGTVENISYFDTIDFSGTNTYSQSTAVDILSADPVCAIQLASAIYEESAIEASAQANLRELIPGLELPAQFNVKNTGTSTIQVINVKGGDIDVDFAGLNLLPGQSTTLTANYAVPTSNIKDVVFTLTPEGGEAIETTLVLNRPDVGISNMRVLREADGERDVQVILTNMSGIPLQGSGKTVKLAFYKDSERKHIIGEEIVIDPSLYADIDQGIGSVTTTIALSDFMVPSASSARLYAYAWVKDVEELYPYDNAASTVIKRLSLKSGGEIFTVDQALQANADGSYTVYFDVRNNANVTKAVLYSIGLYDKDGVQVGRKLLSEEALTLQSEETVSRSLTFTSDELSGTPVSIHNDQVTIVWLDYGTLSYVEAPFIHKSNETYYLVTNENGKLDQLPTATVEEGHFNGWYTAANADGEFVTTDTVFTKETTIYAYASTHTHKYTYKVDGNSIVASCSESGHDAKFSNTITLNAPNYYHEDDEGDPNAFITGRIDEVEMPEIVYKKGDTVLSAAPTTRGDYTASITLGDATVTVSYTITKPLAKITVVPQAIKVTDDGSGTILPLVVAGEALYGEMVYALGTDTFTVPTSWSKVVPEASEAHSYYVWYKVVADADHYDTDPVCLRSYIYGSQTDPIPYVNYEYVDGVTTPTTLTVPEGYVVLSEENKLTAWTNNWYVIKQDLTIEGNITVSGNVQLLLCDGASLMIRGKITVKAGAKFNVYTQGARAGILNVVGTDGVGLSVSGSIHIYCDANIAGKEIWKYTEDELLELHKDDPTIENEVTGYQIAVETVDPGMGYNTEIAVFGSTVNFTGVQLNKYGELRFYGSKIDTSGITLQGQESRLIVYDTDIKTPWIKVAGWLSYISIHGGRIDIQQGLTAYSGASLQFDMFGGEVYMYERFFIDGHYARTSSVNLYGGLLAVRGTNGRLAALDFLGQTFTNIWGGTLFANGERSGVYDINVYSGTAYLAYRYEVLYMGDANGNKVSNDDAALKAAVGDFADGVTKYFTIKGSNPATATGVKYIAYESPFDTVGVERTAYNCVEINTKNKPADWGNANWYFVTEDVTYDEMIRVRSDAHLILKDGVTLNANIGIWIANSKLSIYGQEKCTGMLNAVSANGYAAIDNQGDLGALYVHGGRLNLNGGDISALRVSSFGFYDGLVKIRGGSGDPGRTILGEQDAVFVGYGTKIYDDSSNFRSTKALSSIRRDDFKWHEYTFRGLSVHLHFFSVAAEGDSFVATCTEPGCDLPEHKFVWTPKLASGYYTGEPFTVDASEWDWIGMGLNYTYYRTSYEGQVDGYKWSLWSDAPRDVGHYFVDITVSGGEGKVRIPYSIYPRPVTISWNEGSASFVYDGQPHHPEVVVEGLCGQDKLWLSYDGEQTEVGTYTTTVSVVGSNGNYSVPEPPAPKEFTITPKPINATIVAKTSVYGEDQVALEATVAEGAIVEGDGNVFKLSCSVSKTSNAGKYDITGETTNPNYKVTFLNGDDAYTVTQKALTVTANNNTITYGDAPSANGVTYEGFVNGENESVLGGTLAFTYNYEQFGHVTDSTHTYLITPCGYDEHGNYAFTYLPGVLLVGKKMLTVTANPNTITYGEAPSNADVSFVGFVNNEDRSVLGGTLAFAYDYEQYGQASDETHTYTITPSGYTAENYQFTYETGVLTVNKKVLTVTANANTITYGDAPSGNGVTFDGFVGNDDVNDLGGELGYTYNYAQFGHVTDSTHAYLITPEGYTSPNYEFKFEAGVLTVMPKEITVTIVAKTSVYGDEQVALEATTEEGAIVNNDTGVYSLSCEVTKLSPVGVYDIKGSDDSDNYDIDFANEKDAYSVTKKALTVTANPHTITYGEAPSNADVSFVGFVNNEDRSVLGGTLAFAYNYEQYDHVSGEGYAYTITPSGYTSDNYEITFVEGTLTVKKKALTVTAEPKTITYGDAPSNSGVTYSGFVGGEDEEELVGELVYSYNYEQFGHVSDAKNVYAITPSGYTAENYEITFETGVLTVVPKAINVTIVAKTSVYGDEQVTLEATTLEGAIVNDDTGVYSLSCEVTKLSPVGAYDILGSDDSDNYEITFIGEKDAYTVTKKALTVTANPHTITYGDEPSNADVSFEGFVNDEDRSILGGKLDFAYSYEQFGHVSDDDHAYAIIPSGYTSDNYDIVYSNGVLTVVPKKIDVTIVPKSSIYGENQVALEATTLEGAIVNNDAGVYSLSCVMDHTSHVGTYDIIGSDDSDNYDITFIGEKDAYTVTKKALTVTANPHTITYGDAPSNADVSFEGFVNDEDRNVLGGELAFAYGYEQFGHVTDATHAYTITPSGYTSHDYEITFVTGVLTVVPKKIDVTIVPKTSIYADQPVALEATTIEGAVVNGDTGLYSLACEVSNVTPVGTYDIIGTDLSDNYEITFVGEDNAYTIIQRRITATVQDETIKYGETLPTYRFELSEKIADAVLAELQSKITYACKGDPLVPGKYDIDLLFKDGYDNDTVLHDYGVTLVGGNLYVLAKTLKPETNTNVQVNFENASDAFAYGIGVDIQVVDTGASAQQSGLDYQSINNAYVDYRSEMSKVYSIKLTQTVIVDGQEVVKEIQPSDIQEGLTLLIKLEIPSYLVGRNFRILHIHSANDIEFIAPENITIEDGYVTVRVNRFSEFGFVHLKANEEMNHMDFCLGWVLFILDVLLLGCLGLYFALKRRKSLSVIGLLASIATLIYAIVAILLHVCIITIVSFALSVLLFIAWLVFYFLNTKKPSAPAAEVAKEAPAKVEEAVSASEPEDGGMVVDAEGNYFNIRYNRSFTAKLIQSSDETKGYYGQLKNDALAYKKAKSRISWSCDSINAGRDAVAKFGIRGKTLCLYLPLDPATLDPKYKVEKVESAKYAAVPCLYRIKNDRRLRYAEELLALACANLGLVKGEAKNEDYYLPYEDTEALLHKALIKEVRTAASLEEVEKAKGEGVIRADMAPAADPEDGGMVVDAKGNYFNIRFNRSFTAKLIQSTDETKGYYGELKNDILSYDKAKSRISWSCDSINAGRDAVAKFGIRGKTLCLYLPLDPATLDPKYKVEKVDSVKYAAVPCMYRIKNDRRLRYAKELIATVCANLGLAKGEAKSEDYYLPYEGTDALLAKALIKEVRTAASAEEVERAKQQGTIQPVKSVSANEVNSLVSDEAASAAIENEAKRAIGKKGIINVDDLSANFNDGDTVTLKALKEKGMIGGDIRQVKLLARGNLDKVLHVELQDYSIEAVKMILATGGTVKKV